MKTARILLSILGVTLATLSFGQLISHHEISKESDLDIARYMEQEGDVLFYMAEYNVENGRIMHWLNHRPGNNYNSLFSKDNETLMLSRAYFAREVDALYEDHMVLESWMTIPFPSSFEDSELQIEEWMTTPFQSEVLDEVLEIEPWMTSSWI